MNVSMTGLLSLYLFESTRRAFSLQLMLERLPPDAFPRLRAKIELALAEDHATCELEAHWKGGAGKPDYPAGAGELDAQLDRAIKALDDSLRVSQTAFGEASSRGSRARLARRRLFPKGVREITRQPYVKQAVMVSTLLSRVEAEPELAEGIRELDAQPYLERVAELNARYREVLGLERDDRVTYDELRSARESGQERFSRVVIQLLALLVNDDVPAAEAEALEKALQVVLDQNAKIKRYRQRRRRPVGVDLDTGEELGDEDEAEDEDVEDETDASQADAA